ncbi:MAG: RNA methyltransferase [Bacteroidota bacterium]
MITSDLLNYLEGFLTEERKTRFQQVLSKRTTFLTVAIEDVYQLHNTSAILRSCDAFGIQKVHIISEHFRSGLDKNIALGAQQWVDVLHYPTTSDCLEYMKETGYTIVATTPDSRGTALPDFEITAKTALFFGTEKEGLSPEVVEQADDFVHIPMVGFSESLNVSVAAAIVIQVLTDRLRTTDLSWPLSPQEILDKRLDWTKKSIKNVEQIIDRYPNF